MKICPSCSTQNVNSAKFCSKCGKSLSVKLTCPYCKQQIKPTDTYCNNCGRSLKETDIKKPRKKLSRLKKILISVGAFFGTVIIAFAGLFLYARYYLVNQYTFSSNQKGEVKLVKKAEVENFSAGTLTFCDSIDENTLLPKNQKEVFDIGFKKLYAALDVKGLTSNDEVGFKWINKDTGKEILNYTYQWPINECYYSGIVYFPLVLPDDADVKDYRIFGQPGKYEVESYYNNKLIDSACFEVIAPDITFGNLIVFDRFDAETSSPQNVTDSYNFETSQLFSAVKLSGAVKVDDNFRFALKDVKTGDILKENVISYSDFDNCTYFGNNLYFYIYGPYSDKEITLKPGQYEVDFYHNGELASSSTFSINLPKLSFGELVTSKDKNEDESPVDPTDEFILGTTKINASIYVSGADSNDKWKFTWSNKDKVIREFEDLYFVKEGEYFSGYKSLTLYIPEGQSIKGVDIFGYPGEYTVSFYHNSNLIDSKVFKVIEKD